jgi:predicted RNA-binding Zn ribbon-like protein
MPPRDPSTAPVPLRWVEDLINTRSLVYGTDDLAGADDLAEWLAERDLLPGEADARPNDLHTAVRLREGMRALLAARDAPDVEAGSIAELDGLARELPLVVTVSAGGPPRLVPLESSPVSAALAQLLGIVAAAGVDGTWERLKVCRNEGCRFAYYDHSRNKSRTWCSMETCGNQAKARAFRRRH